MGHYWKEWIETAFFDSFYVQLPEDYYFGNCLKKLDKVVVAYVQLPEDYYWKEWIETAFFDSLIKEWIEMLGIFNSVLYYYFSFKSRLYFGFHLF